LNAPCFVRQPRHNSHTTRSIIIRIRSHDALSDVPNSTLSLLAMWRILTCRDERITRENPMKRTKLRHARRLANQPLNLKWRRKMFELRGQLLAAGAIPTQLCYTRLALDCTFHTSCSEWQIKPCAQWNI